VPHPTIERDDMQIDKKMILDLLRERGQQDEAKDADQQLPDKVDTDQHGGLLSKYGLDVQTLLTKFGGGGGGGIGGLLG
jgi:hypothetical protein